MIGAGLFIGVCTVSDLYGNPKDTFTIGSEDVVSVYDGDTFKVNLNGLPPVFGKNMSIRPNAIDTPEIRGMCDYEKELAKEAKNFTSVFLLGGDVIELRNVKRGKYFRIVADVYVDGQSLAKGLVQHKLGYQYYGKTMQSWCDGSDKSKTVYKKKVN
jgi:endonuclease YncB( thermonuclease family)